MRYRPDGGAPLHRRIELAHIPWHERLSSITPIVSPADYGNASGRPEPSGRIPSPPHVQASKHRVKQSTDGNGSTWAAMSDQMRAPLHGAAIQILSRGVHNHLHTADTSARILTGKQKVTETPSLHHD